MTTLNSTRDSTTPATSTSTLSTNVRSRNNGEHRTHRETHDHVHRDSARRVVADGDTADGAEEKKRQTSEDKSTHHRRSGSSSAKNNTTNVDTEMTERNSKDIGNTEDQTREDKVKARGRYRGERRRSRHRGSLSPTRSSRSRSGGRRRRSPRGSGELRRSDRRDRHSYRSRGYRSGRRRSRSRSPSYRRRRRRRSFSRSRSRSHSSHRRRRRSRSRRRSSSRSSRSPRESRQEKEAKQRKEQQSALMRAAVSGVTTPTIAGSSGLSSSLGINNGGLSAGLGSASTLAGLAGLNDPATRALVQQLVAALNSAKGTPGHSAGGLGALAGKLAFAGGSSAPGSDPSSMLLTQLLTGNMATLGMSSMHPQLTRPARRVYVGNLPIDNSYNDQVLTEYFTQCSQGFGVQTPKPVKSVWIHSERTFGFVEFRSVRDTTLCLKLFEGVPLGGRALRFGRPMDYKAPPPGLQFFCCDAHELQADKEECMRFLQPDSVAEVYARQIFKGEDVSELVQKMGMSAVGGPVAGSLTSTGSAASSLTVVPPPTPSIGITPASTFVNNPQSDSAVATAAAAAIGAGGLSHPPSSAAVTAANGSSGASSSDSGLSEVIVMNGMFNDEESIDLSNPDEMDDIVGDVKDTCAEFGTVLKVHIPKPGQTGYGRCFVQFGDSNAAKRCVNGMDGRTFGGDDNTISCVFFSLAEFNRGNYGADCLTG